MAAPVGQRLARRLTAGAPAQLTFELVDEDGAPASDLEGAVATGRIRRILTPPLDAELTALPVALDADEATATLTLSPARTRAIEPPAGEAYNLVEITIKIATPAGGVHFHGPARRELWGAA